jgi:hypothetical protein
LLVIVERREPTGKTTPENVRVARVELLTARKEKLSPKKTLFSLIGYNLFLVWIKNAPYSRESLISEDLLLAHGCSRNLRPRCQLTRVQ